MLSDLKNQAVIYMWFNKITGKVYIGSAIEGKKRLSRYFMPSVLKTNSRIYKNILKYAHNSFSVSILEVLGETKSVSKSYILAREQFYLDWALKTYGLQVLNLLTETNSSLGLKHTLETKSKIAEARLGKFHSTDTKNKLSQMFSGRDNPFFGKKHTYEFITKLKQRTGEANPMYNKAKSEAFLIQQAKGKLNPRFGQPISKEELANRYKKIYVYNSKKELIKSCASVKSAIKDLHISAKTLRKYRNSDILYKGMYIYSKLQ